MTFLHEIGHAIWGIVAGGKLTYMKIAYLEIYPYLTLSSKFVLGLTIVEGLTTDFARGLFLLGGSVTTNIISWLLALICSLIKHKVKLRITLKILGLFGILDLPFYVFLPQIGLRHWFILGGKTPEPLLGARKIGISDSTFYIIIILSTFRLLFLYFKSYYERCWRKIKYSLSIDSNKVWITKFFPI